MDHDLNPEEALRREKARKTREESLLMGIRTAQNILTRYSKIEDPVIRFSLILDKFILTSDIGMAALKTFGIIDEVSSETKSEIETCQKAIQEEMMALMEWIQKPIYSPNHPFGSKVMEESKESFHTTAGSRK